jgi:hypothetical protein
MDGGRRGSSRAIAELGSARIAFVALTVVACGDAFTTAPQGVADAGGVQDAIAVGDSVAPVDAGKPWCASQDATHTFCEDFTAGVPDMISTEVITGGGTISADTTDFTSAPQSFLATSPALTDVGASASAIASKAFSSAIGSHFSLSLDLKIDSSCVAKSAKNGVSVLALDFADTNYNLVIQVLPGEIDAFELSGQTVTQAHQFQTIVPNGWQRWALDVDGTATLGTSAAPKTINLTVGSTTIFKEALQKAPIVALAHPQLVIGAIVKNAVGESPACKIHVDDILFDVRTLAMPL